VLLLPTGQYTVNIQDYNQHFRDERKIAQVVIAGIDLMSVDDGIFP
jgi:hypothetical protein